MGEKNFHTRKELMDEIISYLADHDDDEFAEKANEILIHPDNIRHIGDGLFDSHTNYN